MKTLKKLKVYYTEKQVADAQSFSPSAAKPREVVEEWLKRYPIEIVRPAPARKADFCLAHDPDYVHGVLRCKRSNGFGNTSKSVADSLPYTTGSLVSAAKQAYKYKTVTCSPTSGFHHACYSRGGGFCTFNGLIVAAQKLKLETDCKRVGILDLDEHYGNGTDDIIERLGLDYIDHFTGGQHYHSEKQADDFLNDLSKIIRDKFNGCDIVLYQAGADPHIDDPLGGWLTTDQMRKRDFIVFQTLKDMNIPVTWNLAGGYQDLDKILDIHNGTLEMCLEVFGKEEEGVA